jgi:hypothetical protein
MLTPQVEEAKETFKIQKMSFSFTWCSINSLIAIKTCRDSHGHLQKRITHNKIILKISQFKPNNLTQMGFDTTANEAKNILLTFLKINPRS